MSLARTVMISRSLASSTPLIECQVRDMGSISLQNPRVTNNADKGTIDAGVNGDGEGRTRRRRSSSPCWFVTEVESAGGKQELEMMKCSMKRVLDVKCSMSMGMFGCQEWSGSKGGVSVNPLLGMYQWEWESSVEGVGG